MIRIDLRKDANKQGASLRQAAARFKLEPTYDKVLAYFDNDLSRLIVFVTAAAIAVLPYLLLQEYQRAVERSFDRKAKAIAKELGVVEAEIQALLPFKKELESYEAQKAQVNQRLAVIRALIDSRGTPVTVLDSIGQALPEGVWLEGIAFDDTQDPREKVALHGRALTNEDISDFVDRLSQSTYLKNVRIGLVETALFQNVEVRAFTIDLEANSPGTLVTVGEGPKATQGRDVGSTKK